MESKMDSKKTKKSTRKQKQRNKLIVFGVEVVLLIVVVAGLAIFTKLASLYNKVETGEKLDNSEAGINDIDTEQAEVLKGYTNIALFGLDNRTVGNYESGRSDTIMVASINNETKEVKLVSVYRDTYLSVGGGKYNKANTAYSYGGIKQAVQMLNTNLDLDITQYVCVDWTAVIETIDALGGIEIDLTSAEVTQLNKYLKDVDAVTGQTTEKIKSSGVQTLNGSQATTYARIRKTSGNDYRRASRQRIVLEAMLNKAKDADVNTLLNICENIFDDIQTNLTLAEILDLAMDVREYEISSTSGFPFDLVNRSLSGSGDSVVPVSLTNNVSKLHEYLFGTADYVPSLSVRAINDTIIDKTGVDENTTPYDMDQYNDTSGQNGTVFD